MLEMIGIYGEMRSYVKFSLQKCLDTFRTILKDYKIQLCIALKIIGVRLIGCS